MIRKDFSPRTARCALNEWSRKVNDYKADALRVCLFYGKNEFAGPLGGDVKNRFRSFFEQVAAKKEPKKRRTG